MFGFVYKMAKLPNISKINLEDVPKKHKNWFGKILQTLNIFLSSVVAALDGNLAFGDNINAQIKTLEFIKTTSAFPLRFKHTLKNKRPVGVLKADITDISSSPASLTAAVDLSWTYTQAQEVQINNITGLTTDQRYRLTLLVF